MGKTEHVDLSNFEPFSFCTLPGVEWDETGDILLCGAPAIGVCVLSAPAGDGDQDVHSICQKHKDYYDRRNDWLYAELVGV